MEAFATSTALQQIRASLLRRTPDMCGCAHEARFADLVRSGRSFSEAVSRGFCTETRRKMNVLCAHSTGTGVLPDAYEREIAMLIDAGLAPTESTMRHAADLRSNIMQIDSDAGIAGRAGMLDQEAVRARQQSLVEELLALRNALLCIIDNALSS